jgi:hypothetical protein
MVLLLLLNVDEKSHYNVKLTGNGELKQQKISQRQYTHSNAVELTNRFQYSSEV